ncbi:hypothetical protein FSARC_4818 [Fusarium sarcochroum]|uniref:Myb-like domain-containing protein n=1 Tax=Fusarium sarcochroum TaxID=1208366 RepID=A0A8H4U196_9HYPO|nr:hypothetical protein FSARC_4818 [Fusarium sarcochroum]
MSSFTPINRRPEKMSDDGNISSDNNSSDSSSSSDNNSSGTNSSGTNTNINNNAGRLRPWQRQALQNGRTPLPEAPGDRPWLQTPSNPPPSSSYASASVVSSSPGPGSGNQASASGTNAGQASSPTSAPQTYRFWTEEEMRRLITIRNGGAGWPDIFAAFPHRTPEAIKQTYHKRRYAIERQMQQEAAAAAATTAGPSEEDDEMVDDEPKGSDRDDEI